MSKTHNFGLNTKFLKIGALNTEFDKNRKIRDISVLRLKILNVLRLFLAKTRILYLLTFLRLKVGHIDPLENKDKIILGFGFKFNLFLKSRYEIRFLKARKRILKIRIKFQKVFDKKKIFQSKKLSLFSGYLKTRIKIKNENKILFYSNYKDKVSYFFLILIYTY